MNTLTTQELIDKLIEIDPKGLEVSLRNGMLNYTSDIFIRKNLVFHFDLSERWIFRKRDSMEIKDFLAKYESRKWIIDQTID